MSIVEDMKRIQQAKQDIKASISNKGMQVSSQTNLRNYSNLIDQIDEDYLALYLWNICAENGTSCKGLFESIVTPFLNVTPLDTSNVVNMESMFAHCESSSIEMDCVTSNVVNMESMFAHCSNLTSLNLSSFNTSKVINMSDMFYNSIKLINLDLSNFDTSNVTTMYRMFNYCINLTSLDLSNWDIRNVTNMEKIFEGCNKLKTLNLSNWDMSYASIYAIESVLETFYAKNLNLSNWNVNNLTDLSAFFQNSDLKTLNLSNWNINNVTDMSSMFSNCNNLTSLDLSNFNTSKVTDMRYLFYYCNKLTTIIGEIDMSNVENADVMFAYNNALTSVRLKNIYKNVRMTDHYRFSLDFSSSKISDYYLYIIITELPDLIVDKKLSTTYCLTIFLPYENTLTQSQVQPAINKGWNVANINYW